MSKNTHPASYALRELKAYHERQAAPARIVAFKRWPERVVVAGTEAKARRRWVYSLTTRGAARAAAWLDYTCRRLLETGMVSW
jgi:hypothetical protein